MRVLNSQLNEIRQLQKNLDLEEYTDPEAAPQRGKNDAYVTIINARLFILNLLKI